MSHYKVTPQEIRNAKEDMTRMVKSVDDAFEEMMNSLLKIDGVFVNSKTGDIVRILGIRKNDFLSAKANLKKTINNLEQIAGEYETAERDNVNELHTVN